MIVPSDPLIVEFKYVFVTSEDAVVLKENFLHNHKKWEIQKYFNEENKKIIDSYKNTIITNMWEPFNQKFIDEKSIILFPKDDNYLSFSEGRHRIFALSDLVGEVEGVYFLCGIGWPGKLSDLLTKHKKDRHFHHVILKEVVEKCTFDRDFRYTVSTERVIGLYKD